MKLKPHIVRNNHKNPPYKWRCFWGRYNGYADTVDKALASCLLCAWKSKHLMPDIKRYPQLAKVLTLF